MAWHPDQLPRREGRVFAVTGGNAGIGYFIAEQLASTGAKVLVLGRNPEKVGAALRSIRAFVPNADVDSIPLDLASLESVRDAGERLAALERLDGLVENAGVLAGSKTRQVTSDGFEMMFGTNHLGHFVLTAAALPALERTSGSRVVTMGSLSTKMVKFDGSDRQSEHAYKSFRSYAQSKHATEQFGFELDRRLLIAASPTRALVAHPGGGMSGLSPQREWVGEGGSPLRTIPFAMQGKDRGAWPAVRAVLDPDAEGGQYYGPALGGTGSPVIAKPVASSRDPQNGVHLWEYSEQLVGAPFAIEARA
jgi:NAD(P)-dependent dehydrogenase (short-subunit alcohol dehydrogenase family)